MNGVTLTDSDWFNDVNRLHYTIFNDPATGAAGFGTVINALTADATPDQDADFLVTYDLSATTGKKVLVKNIKRMAPITASLGADVALNNTGNYFDGPSIAQGTTGTWFVSGTVSVTSSTTDIVYAKLWDGATVIASTSGPAQAGVDRTMSLSGFITSPAGNLRISCKDVSSTNGKITFNTTGNSADSTLTAIRIA